MKSQNPVLFMKGINATQMKNILDFIYCGEANVKQEDSEDFMMTAQYLQVKGLEGTESTEEPLTKNTMNDDIDYISYI